MARTTVTKVVFPLLASALILSCGCGKPAEAELPRIENPEMRSRPLEEVAKPHLAKADQECDRAIEEQLQALDAFFKESKGNTRGFADEALGWGSKRRLLQDALPFTRSDRHKEFIQRKFGETVFSREQLEASIRQVVKGYLARVRSIESKMLVDLRADAADIPGDSLLARLNDKRLQEGYDSALAKAIESAGGRLQEAIAGDIVSTIAGEVLAQVAIRMGVRAGFLGAGAAAGTVTLGVGLLAGLIVDHVWDWYSDPKANLAGEIDKKLDEVNRLLADGLRQRLREFSRKQSGIRGTIVIRFLQPSGEPRK